uniref:Uncharacterized protein n=1 Tax=Lactococcus lactis subsp. lactis TaxID=1360 RepID=A0AAC9R3M5_LACLL
MQDFYLSIFTLIYLFYLKKNIFANQLLFAIYKIVLGFCCKVLNLLSNKVE